MLAEDEFNFHRPSSKSDIMSIHSCTHDYIHSDGICASCGLVVQTLYNPETGILFTSSSSRAHSGADRGILPDMINIDIPEEVKAQANNIYRNLNPSTHRGQRRRYLVFFCIFNAYRELGISKDPKDLAKLVKIKPSDVTKAFTLFSEIQTGYRTASQKVTPLDLIPEYCARLDAVPNVELVLELAESILKKSDDPNNNTGTKLQEMYPQKVAAGIIQYYLNINGIKFNKKRFAEVMGLSEATISSMYRVICMIDNA